jgi:nucleoside-diphosphate-sugar epimerase
MRVLVTGGSGHLGSYIVRELLRRGHEVAVLVRAGRDPWRLADVNDQVQRVYGDLTNLAEAADAIKRFAPESVIHAGWAGVGSERRQDPQQILTNVFASLTLVRIASEVRAVSWIGIGSQAEYGESGILSERERTRPQNLYGVAKLAVAQLSEALCREYGMRFVWLRLFATYGPMDDRTHLIPFLIDELQAGREPALTPGDQKWDYLYVEDAAAAIRMCAERDDVRGVFNLGSGTAVSVREIAEQVRASIETAVPLRFGARPYPPGQIMHLQADASRLRAALNWKPVVELADGLLRTVAWHSSAPPNDSSMSTARVNG